MRIPAAAAAAAGALMLTAGGCGSAARVHPQALTRNIWRFVQGILDLYQFSV